MNQAKKEHNKNSENTFTFLLFRPLKIFLTTLFYFLKNNLGNSSSGFFLLKLSNIVDLKKPIP